MSLLQFDRQFAITIGPPGGFGRVWTDIRLSFDIQRSTGKTPNKARFQLYNLDPVSRSIVETSGAFVTFLAGYVPTPSLLFRGDISRRGVKVERQGPVRIVTIEAGDGELNYRDARFDQNFGPATPNSTILPLVLLALGLGVGPGDPLPPVVYGSGISFYGPARNALARLAEDAGVELSVQDGLVLFLLPGSTTKDGIASITSESGLIGSPTPTRKGVNLRALLNPQIRPGRLIDIVSESYVGPYRAVKVRHSGDTEGPEWTTTVEAVPVG